MDGNIATVNSLYEDHFSSNILEESLYIYTAASLLKPVVSWTLLPCVKRPQFTLNWLPVVRCYYWNRKWEILGKTNIQGEIDGEGETDKHERVPDNSAERQHQGQTDLISIHSSHWCTCTLTARLAGLTAPLRACLSYQGFQLTVGSQHPKDELERFPKQRIQPLINWFICEV